ncbi:DNA-protecting protein DprA, partial [Candidatus Parcubacteria bacterium]|nr:DNA-protecting protein DprA [Candidatus Parcubacteria bacterium]
MEDIRRITIKDTEYPTALKNISDAPEVLYYRGALPADGGLRPRVSSGSAPRIGVVGTRYPSDYGKEAVLKITGELASAGFI